MKTFYVILLGCLAATGFARADQAVPAPAPMDITQLSLEDLMHVKVTIASKKPEEWFDTAAAVFVLSGDDIARSGASTIADALRGVPGSDVAKLDAHTWAVSLRGFNDQFNS